MTRSEENYLKTIYQINLEGGTLASTNAIAAKLKTKASSVTDMIKRLSKKALVRYERYRGAELTAEGEDAAIQIIRKHRLWEVFLVDKLGFNWDEVHAVAEQLEHIKSDKLIEALDHFLDYPTHDPHGDPIPDERGQIKRLSKQLIETLTTGQQGICVGVKDSSSAFLRYLDKLNIAIGDTIVVVSKEEFDGSMTIEIGAQQHQISSTVSKNIYVKRIQS